MLGHTGKSLVIGGGGGRDIHNLRSSGVDDIDVIELNEGIRQIVDDKMSVFSGSPYSMPGVHTTIGDGRSILARRGLYDQIQISFTDSLSAGGAAAYALSENNLYTVEAFQEYLDHLAPGGILAVTRRYQLVGDEALRATVLALETLRRNGVEHPEQQRRRGARTRHLRRALRHDPREERAVHRRTSSRRSRSSPPSEVTASRSLRVAPISSSGPTSRRRRAPVRSATRTSSTSARRPTTDRSSST